MDKSIGNPDLLQIELAEEQKRKDELIKRIEHNINPGHESVTDKCFALNKGNNYYESVSELFESIGNLKGYLKVPYRFEIIDVLEAMKLAFGIIDEEKVNGYRRSDDVLIGIDGEWITELSEIIRKHWEHTRDFHENIHEKSLSSKK